MQHTPQHRRTTRTALKVAVSTYLAAGFTAREQVADLQRNA